MNTHIDGDLIIRLHPRERRPWWHYSFVTGEELARELGLHDISPRFTLAHRTLATLALGRALFGRRHPAASAFLHGDLSSVAKSIRLSGPKPPAGGAALQKGPPIGLRPTLRERWQQIEGEGGEADPTVGTRIADHAGLGVQLPSQGSPRSGPDDHTFHEQLARGLL